VYLITRGFFHGGIGLAVGVVDRNHAWINRFRRLLIRWEKKANSYLAFLHSRRDT